MHMPRPRRRLNMYSSRRSSSTHTPSKRNLLTLSPRMSMPSSSSSIRTTSRSRSTFVCVCGVKACAHLTSDINANMVHACSDALTRMRCRLCHAGGICAGASAAAIPVCRAAHAGVRSAIPAIPATICSTTAVHATARPVLLGSRGCVE